MQGSRTSIALGTIALVALIAIGAFVLVGGADGAASVTATQVARTATPAPPEPAPVASTPEELADFEAQYGSPPETVGRVRIPRVGVDAALGNRAVGADGGLPLPAGPGDIVHYDFKALPGYGGEFGRPGNVILAGHADYNASVKWAGAGVRFNGRAVLYFLGDASPQDLVEVTTGNQTLRYRVEWVRTIPASTGDWGEIMSSNAGGEVITLITCVGEFDVATLEYSDRLVLRAKREPAPRAALIEAGR